MGRKRSFNKTHSAPRPCDEIVASFQCRLKLKYGVEIVQPMPEKMIELLVRLELMTLKD